MSTTKSSGTTKLGRNSNPKYLGIKLYDGQEAKKGTIIVRQRGTKIFPGKNVKIGKDFTIYAVKQGKIKFSSKSKIKFNGNKRIAKVVNVE
ncbi:MAG: 50S ribosomal protein L27 [Patescibacteria group bacterium]|nr:50S ribosomal protein L27 [Patescibacteria group bacterium]